MRGGGIGARGIGRAFLMEEEDFGGQVGAEGIYFCFWKGVDVGDGGFGGEEVGEGCVGFVCAGLLRRCSLGSGAAD